MEESTAKGYVEAFIANQNNKEEWIADYKDGMSVRDLWMNDSLDIYIDEWDENDNPVFIVDCGQNMLLLDPENYEVRYEI